MLNKKQREILSGTLIRLAEYTILSLVIGQIALGRFNPFIAFESVASSAIIYFIALYVLRKYD